MKRILLMSALVGLLASSAVANTFGDDKNKKDSKKTEKSCAGEKKEGCAKGEKSCCKSKGTKTATENTDTKSTEKK